MEWKYVKPLKDENSIIKFETIIDRELPSDYKKFIMNSNGARPLFKLFKTKLGDERVIKSFLSFNQEDKENIFEVRKWLSKKLPITDFAIGIDPSGNFICYNAKFELYFWNHETLEITIIANSFTNFLNILY